MWGGDKDSQRFSTRLLNSASIRTAGVCLCQGVAGLESLEGVWPDDVTLTPSPF